MKIRAVVSLPEKIDPLEVTVTLGMNVTPRGSKEILE
jgi:hypothetical protein